jgi:hypothetical protein
LKERVTIIDLQNASWQNNLPNIDQNAFLTALLTLGDGSYSSVYKVKRHEDN